MAIFTKFALGPYRVVHVSSERIEIGSQNLVSLLLKSHVNVWLSFKQILNLTKNGDFAPPTACRFLPNLHSALIGPYLQNEERSVQQTWSVRYWSIMLMFGWVLKKSKIWLKIVILPHPRYGDFYLFCFFFNSTLKGPSLENERRSLHQTWSTCYWSPMSMFGLKKSRISLKMMILPHPRYGDFYQISTRPL